MKTSFPFRYVMAVAILFVLIWILPSATAGQSAAPVSLTFTDLSGKSHSLEEYRGKVVVPGTVILNPEGGVEFRIVGEASKKDVVSRMEWLLSDRSSKKPKELQKNL